MRRYVGAVIGMLAAGCVVVPPPKAPGDSYTPLKMPLEKIPLPALFVSDGQTLSGGCLQQATPTETASLSTLARQFVASADFQAGIKAEFERKLVDVGADASAAHKLAQSFELEASDLTVDSVDPATLVPNFKNPACTEPELAWFVNNRSIVVEGIRAAELKITSGAVASSDIQAKLDAALGKIKTEAGTTFANTTGQNNSVTMTAKNVFFGIHAVPMVAKKCEVELKMKDGVPETICDGRYEVSVTPAPVGNRYQLSVTPKNGETMDFDLEFARQSPKAIGDLRILYANVKRGAPMQATIGIILVGASGTP